MFLFNDTATTESYTLSLHDALPICENERLREEVGRLRQELAATQTARRDAEQLQGFVDIAREDRSEEHTSELQSRQYLVCRLLLEKNKHNTDLPPPASRYYRLSHSP